MKLFKELVYFIYPKKCMFCEEIIAIDEEDFICRHCYMELEFIKGDREPNISVLEYDDKIRLAILSMKYYGKKQYAKGFAKLMYEKFYKISENKYDLIINVPMYAKKKRKRGYDQAEALAEYFSKISGIHFEKDNLIRYKNTKPQSKVTLEERKTNVQNVFKVNKPEDIEGKNIILIDDIYTSGNTMSQCARELKMAGANNICYFTIAKVVMK